MAEEAKAATADTSKLREHHDQAYKGFFAIMRTLQDLLRGFLPELIEGAEEWFQIFDFEHAVRVNTEETQTGLATRLSDMVWRVPIISGKHAGQHLYVVVLLEFESEMNHFMALRVQGTVARMYDALVRDQRDIPENWLPPVLAVVVYNGKARWTAPTRMGDLVQPGTRPRSEAQAWQPTYTGDSFVVLDIGQYAGLELPADNLMSLIIRTETMDSLTEAGLVLDKSMRQLDTPQLRGLLEHYLQWYYLVLARQGVQCEEVKDAKAMQELLRAGEVRSYLDARISEDRAKLAAASAERGRHEGREEGREQGIEQGIEQGREEGREEGLEHHRKLLQSLAKRRFGTETADRLAARLEKVRGYDRLADIGGWIMDCASGMELLSRVEGHP